MSYTINKFHKDRVKNEKKLDKVCDGLLKDLKFPEDDPNNQLADLKQEISDRESD